MPVRLLVAIAASLFIFQLAFSILYSTRIVSLNHNFNLLQDKYFQLENQNQILESKYIDIYKLNDQ